MKDLLICISAHYNPERIKYLEKVLNNFILTYKCSFDIIIDTNTQDLEYLNSENIQVVVATNLTHPFHLTSLHRQHIKDNIDKYKNFIYVEDDILVPYDNYLNYLENFKILYPKYVPLFVRIEYANGKEYVSDIVTPQSLVIIEVGESKFIELTLPNNYHGFWIMPQKELRESITEQFTKLSEGREWNAMWPGWCLGKRTLLQIIDGMISKKCYSYHLPNNYAESKDTIQAKIESQNIFL